MLSISIWILAIIVIAALTAGAIGGLFLFALFSANDDMDPVVIRYRNRKRNPSRGRHHHPDPYTLPADTLGRLRTYATGRDPLPLPVILAIAVCIMLAVAFVSHLAR